MKELDLKPKVVLAVGAHPDDNEYCFGGTIAKWISEGVEVHYLVVSDGSKGAWHEGATQEETAAARRVEQDEAADTLGVKSVTILNEIDGEITANPGLKRHITEHIRKVKPDTVLTIDPSFMYSEKDSYINHPDHRAVGEAVMDSVFPFARDRLTFPEQLEAGLEPHNTANLVFFNLKEPTHLSDISNFTGQKKAALLKHKSQFKPGQIDHLVEDAETMVLIKLPS